MLEGTGKFKYPKRGKTGVIYIPSDVTKDSAFPLKEGEIRVRIEESKLIIWQES